MKDFEKYLSEFTFNSRKPMYNDSSDYTTNAPSYYDDLARKNKLIKHLALRIWEYDKEMLKRLEEWDKKLEDFPEDVKKLLIKWLKDGTLEEIINKNIFGELNDKVDKNKNSINVLERKVDELYVSVTNYGAKGDGVTDDTTAIQETINKHSGIWFPSDKTYKLSQINIPGNKHLKFGQNVKIISDHILNDATQGHIQIKGSPTGLSYCVIGDINTFDYKINIRNVPSNAFNTGDIIELQQDRAFIADSSVTNKKEHMQQHAYAILTVKSFTNGVLEFYETIPYDFKQAHNPIVTKVNPAKNVTIDGNNTVVDLKGMTTHGNFIHGEFTNNLTIGEFKFTNGAGKGIEVSRSNHFHIHDILYAQPTTKVSAKGEGIMISKAGNGVIDRVYCHDSRRGMDFANAWDCVVNDSIMFKGRFTGHGLLSRFINFNQCVVHGTHDDPTSIGFSGGNNSYLHDEYFTFNNCSSFGCFYAVSITDGCEHFTFNNFKAFKSRVVFGITRDSSNIKIIGGGAYQTTTLLSIDDSKDILIKDFELIEDYSSRDIGTIYINKPSKNITIDNVYGEIDRSFFTTIVGENYAPNIIFKDCNIINKKTDKGTVRDIGFYFYVGEHTKKIRIKNCITNMTMRLSGQSDIYLTDSEFSDWTVSDNIPTGNFIVRNNIVTELSEKPIHPIEDVSANIIENGNIFIG